MGHSTENDAVHKIPENMKTHLAESAENFSIGFNLKSSIELDTEI